MKDDRIKLSPIKPIVSRSDYIATYFLVGGLMVGFIGAVISREIVVLAICNLVGFAGLVWFKSRVAEAPVRPIWVCVVLPIGLGISLLALPAGRPLPALVCFATSIFAGLWFFVLRYPPQYRQALKAIRAGHLMEAMKLLSEAIERHPESAESRQLRSWVHILLFQTSEAESDARKAIELNPMQAPNHTSLGLALVAQEKYAPAKQAFDRALELAPQNPIHYYNEGVIFYRLGEFEKALPYLRNCGEDRLPENCRFMRHYYLGSSLKHLGDTPAAQAAYAKLKRYRPIYEKLLQSARDAPDYPSVMIGRRELEEIGDYMR